MPESPSPPRGVLIPIGGAEQRIEGRASPRTRRKLDVLQRVMVEMGGKGARIEILATASSVPERMAKAYERSFTALGMKDIGVLPIQTRHDSVLPVHLERLERADGLMFSGGDQRKIIRAFKKTRFHEIMRRRYREEHFVIAGTSAGAMMMSSVMIFGGRSRIAMEKGRAQITEGLGLLPDAVIDSHFVNRGRFGRMAVAIVQHPELMGIGMAEDTGAVITGGRYLECIGSGHVNLLDGSELVNKVAAPDTLGFPVSFERMIFSLMSRGNRFDLGERTFRDDVALTARA